METFSTALKNNVALLTEELNAALEQQAATSEILRVISSSPNDVQPVFDSIAESGRSFVGQLLQVAVGHRQVMPHRQSS
jgi:two-component system, NtrC family, sensor kinase